MNIRFRLIFLLMLLSGISIRVVTAQTAQTDFATEDDLKKRASKLFDEEEYVKAYPLYSQLVSLYRKDPNFNYRLGVCMLYAGDDKERSITFLEFAANSSDVDKERFFYLAKAYHLNYRFDDAIAQYKKYKKIASSAKAERLQVDRQIEMCGNGKKLFRYITDLSGISKTEMNREDFFRSYDISGIGGKLLVKPDEKEFRTALDKKKNEKSIIYLAANNNQIFFSSYGENDQNGKDIYEMRKLPNGKWSKPQTLGNVINTKYDEDFPFMHPNGKVLYFSSKGHNSMGGYDIFKSIRLEESNTWSEPVNLNFPVNSPDDDILYVTNTEETKAYFASARTSVDGKIAVYHINMEPKPIEVAYINGSYIKNHKRQTFDAKITVKNLSDNTILGVYYTKPANGSYIIKLPNGGRFLFTVEAPDFPVQSEIVEVKAQSEFKPLRQEISYTLETDKLIIKNSFNEPVNDSTYLLALNLIKEKSKMDLVPVPEVVADVVPKEENPTSEENDLGKETKTAPTNTKLSNEDIVKIANKDAVDADTEAKDARQQADIALDFANQKNETAKGKLQEVAALMATASKTQDNIKKQALTDEANAISKEAEQLNKETVITYNLAKKLDMTATSKQEEADLSKQYASGLEAAVKSNNSTDALAKLAELEKKLDVLSQANADRYPTLNSFKRESQSKEMELQKTFQLSQDLKKELSDNAKIIGNLKTDSEKTRNKEEKQGMINQIAELEQENTNKQKALDQNEIKRRSQQKEYNTLKNETELVNTVIEKSKTGTSETVAAKVSAIDKNKLEEQVNTIQSTSQPDNEVASVNTTENNVSPETNTAEANSSSVPSTSPKALTDINKKYDSDLADAEKIKDKDSREREKADVYKKWAEAINADVVKQKQDLAKTTDPEMKALYAKKISDAEDSSKEKQKQSDKSLSKVKKLEKEEIPLAVGFGTTYGNNPVDTIANKNTAATGNVNTEGTAKNTTIPENKNPGETATTAKNVATTNTTNSEETAKNAVVNENNPENKSTTPVKEYSYASSANEQISSANLATNEANELKAQSDALKVQAVKETNPEAKKAKLKQAEEIVKQSNEKKSVAVHQTTLANKAEYQNNQKQLDQFTEKYASNSEDEISIAEMNNDEGKIYFEKAEKMRSQAEATISNSEKETVNENAYKNEMIALERQKKAMDIYKNFKPRPVVAAVKMPVNTNTRSLTSTNAANPSTNSGSAEKKSLYNSPASAAQIVKSDSLNKQAADLMEQSVDLKFKAVAQKSDTNAQKALYAQSEELTKQANQKKLQSSQLVATVNKSEFDANKNQIGQLAKSSAANNSPDLLKAEIMNDEANKYFDKAQKKRTEAASADSYTAKEIALEEAHKDETVALQKQKESMDIYNKYTASPVATSITFGGGTTETEANTPNNNRNVNAANTEVAVTHPVSAANHELVELFEQGTGIVYSAKNPIPIDKQLPDVLIFKVQIGAFRKAIPQNLFKGISPLAGETTPQGFIRYTAGLFLKYNSAFKVKNIIVNLGYKDAFVVAFLNGKRIPINQAYAMEAGVPPTILQVNNPAIIKQPDFVAPPSVSTISGLFYTVQVGVFSQKVPPAKLYNMEPLYTETAPNGNLRYYTGIYTNVVRATEAMDILIDIGIKDAFVTAYYNGKRITKAEAKQYETQGNGVFAKGANINKLPVFKSGAKSNQPIKPVNNEPAKTSGVKQEVINTSLVSAGVGREKQTDKSIVSPSTTSNAKSTEPSLAAIDPGIVFKLQIGAYKEEVPLSVANKFLKIAGKGVKNYIDKNGITIYTVGNFKTYNEASQLKTEVIAADLTDTFIVAFRNGEKIGVEEAKKLSSN